MPDYVRFPLVLMVVTLISATCLTLIYQVAEPKIQEQKRIQEIQAEKVVFPDADRTEEVDAGGVMFKKALQGATVRGYIAKGSAEGYSSTIEVLVGIRSDAAAPDGPLTVNGVTILSQQETPGLGTRIEEITSDTTWCGIITGQCSLGREEGEPVPLPWFTEKYRNLSLDDVKLTADGGKVDGITGATISSRAVTDAVRAALESVGQALREK